jgi:hypothetical protein
LGKLTIVGGGGRVKAITRTASAVKNNNNKQRLEIKFIKLFSRTTETEGESFQLGLHFLDDLQMLRSVLVEVRKVNFDEKFLKFN